MSRSYTIDQGANGFFGWIASYNDGSQSRIITGGGVVNSSYTDEQRTLEANRQGGTCNCEIVRHQVYKSPPLTENSGLWRWKCRSTCGPAETRMCY